MTNAILTLGKNATTSTGQWLPTAATTLTLNQGGQLTIENTVTNLGNRIGDNVAINMIGGTINLTNQSAVAAAETVGAVTLSGGFDTFNIVRTRRGQRRLDAHLPQPAGGDERRWRRFKARRRWAAAPARRT